MSAKSRSSNCLANIHWMTFWLCLTVSLIIQSITMIKSNGDRMHPCLTPVFTSNGVFPSFNIFSALRFSVFESGFVLTLNNISAIGVSGLSAGGSPLRISFKCSSHLDLCSVYGSSFLALLVLTDFFFSLLVFLLYRRVLYVPSVRCHFNLCC